MSIPTKNYGPEFLAALAADIPAPDGAPTMSSEHMRALREGHQIAAADEYFKARDWTQDSAANRNRFDAGFVRGWDARAALAAPAPQAADHSPDAGKKVGGDQAPAEGDDLDRDEAIRVWRRHCDKFSDALKKEPPSPVIDAMLEFARAHVQPKGTLTREEARRYCAAGFQEWLDDSVADGGATVFDILTSVHDAYSGFQAAGSYAPTPKGTPAGWVTLWAEIHRLRAAVQGPDGYATWQEAATAERVRRVAAEKTLAAVQAPAPAPVLPAGMVLVKAYSECGKYADDNPGLRADCARKLERGQPCEKCPTRAAQAPAVVAGDERQDIGGHIRAAANAKVAQQADDDTRRLDYLQKTQATISLVPDGRDGNGTRHAFMVGGWHCSVSRDVRASIDTAMGESQPPVQGKGGAA